MVSPSAVEELLRVFALTSDFVFLPVEVAGPDLAFELAEELTAKGHPCVTIEPSDDASWEGVVTSLFAVERAKDGVVMVIGSRNPPRGVHMGLRLFNQNRGSIVKHLGCALFWCGPESFLELTAESAPDFWSIRAVTRKLEAEAPLPAPAPPPKPAVSLDIADEAMAQGDVQSGARLTLKKARALISQGELEEAASRLFDVLPALRAERERELRTETVLLLTEIERLRPDQTPVLRSRLSLAKGQDLTAKGSWQEAKDAFEEALQEAERAGDKSLVVLCSAHLGAARARLGEANEHVLRRIEENIKEARAIGDRPLEAAVTELLAEVSTRAHDRRSAKQLSKQANEISRASRHEPTTLPAPPPVQLLDQQPPLAKHGPVALSQGAPPPTPAQPPSRSFTAFLAFVALVLLILVGKPWIFPSHPAQGEHRYCFEKQGYYELCTTDKSACDRQRTVLYEDCMRLNKSREECDKLLGPCEEKTLVRPR